MQELNMIEIEEVSGGGPVAAAAVIIVLGVVVLVAIGAIDGWKGEKEKQNQKKEK